MFMGHWEATGAAGMRLLLALLLVSCGGRATDSPQPLDVRLRDPSRLARERCEVFALPDAEPVPLGSGAVPEFGACGHVISWTEAGDEVRAPDFKSVVARAASSVELSPDGTQLLFVPRETPDVLRRLELATGKGFDTRPYPPDEKWRGLAFGLFLADDGSVQSWQCSRDTLRIFGDLSAGDRPLFEAAVPSCPSDLRAESVLFWRKGNVVHAVDLLARRVYDHELPRLPNNYDADAMVVALDGYALALQHNEKIDIGEIFVDQPHSGPLYSTRTGELLAESWGPDYVVQPRWANTDGALLYDDGTKVREWPGVRGVYLFQDRARAFGLTLDAEEQTQLALLDLVQQRVTPLAPYPSATPEPPLGLPLGVSPDERVAYFVAPAPESESGPLSVVRWLDGVAETLPEQLDDLASAPIVANDGTALIATTSGSYVLRPGHAAELRPRLLGAAALNHDASRALGMRFDPPSDGLVLYELDSDDERILIDGARWGTTTIAVDRDRRRLAIAVDSADAPHTLWGGLFP